MTATSAAPAARLDVGSASALGDGTGVSQGAAHPWLTAKPRVQDLQPRVAVPQLPVRRHGEGLAAWGCFPRDSQHSSQGSGGRGTP